MCLSKIDRAKRHTKIKDKTKLEKKVKISGIIQAYNLKIYLYSNLY